MESRKIEKKTKKKTCRMCGCVFEIFEMWLCLSFFLKIKESPVCVVNVYAKKLLIHAYSTIHLFIQTLICSFVDLFFFFSLFLSLFFAFMRFPSILYLLSTTSRILSTSLALCVLMWHLSPLLPSPEHPKHQRIADKWYPSVLHTKPRASHPSWRHGI